MADSATRLGGSPHLTFKRDQLKKSDYYMDKRVTPPPCKQALRQLQAG